MMSARATYAAEFDALTATTDEVRARRQKRSNEVHAFCVTAIAGHEGFPYRNAMLDFLLERYTESVGRALRAEDKGHLTCAVIGLWGDHARLHGIDVRQITAPVGRAG